MSFLAVDKSLAMQRATRSELTQRARVICLIGAHSNASVAVAIRKPL